MGFKSHMDFKSHMHPWREKKMALADDSTFQALIDLDKYDELLGMGFIEYTDWSAIEASWIR
jgi:hypothetical protein